MGMQDVIHVRGDVEVQVVGESHYQRVFDAACGGRTEAGHRLECLAALIPEPNNRYDRNAVVVKLIIDGAERGTAGYLSRDDAKDYRPVLERLLVEHDRFVVCNAMILGGWDRGGGDEGSYGLKLYLTEPEELLRGAIEFMRSQAVPPPPPPPPSPDIDRRAATPRDGLPPARRRTTGGPTREASVAKQVWIFVAWVAVLVVVVLFVRGHT